MGRETYKKQVRLLLDVLPEVAKETCFALHGGTAINLFVRDMPRLSVDIDLIYVPVLDRVTSLENIATALGRVKESIGRVVRQSQVQLLCGKGKLIVSYQGAKIKIEVNLVSRGTITTPVRMSLCEKAQSEFDAFCVVQIVPVGQLYGGKICAALDRQHPRYLFDVKHLLDNEGFSDEVKCGFLLGLVSSDRPINELIAPNFKDQRFLLSVKDVKPDWSIHNFERFPAVQWKLRNLQILKKRNPKKHLKQLEALARSMRTFA